MKRPAPIIAPARPFSRNHDLSLGFFGLRRKVRAMSSNVHPKTRQPSDKDLKQNPGIGASKGTIKGGDLLDDNEELDGDNTFEGDVENDTTPQGGVNPRQTGRTND